MSKPLGDNWVTAEIDPFILRQAVGVRNASQADCEAVARKLTEQFFERDCNWTLIAQAYDSLHDDDDREDNPSKPKLDKGQITAESRAAHAREAAAWKARITPFKLHQLAQALSDASRDPVQADRIFSMLFQYMDDKAITGAMHELAANDEMPHLVAIIEGEHREDNPGKSGLPLGSVAIGAALGAAAIHLFKKRGQ